MGFVGLYVMALVSESCAIFFCEAGRIRRAEAGGRAKR